METLKILFLGDVVGAPGRAMIAKHLAHLQKTYKVDATIVNGENSADGKGITPRIAQFFIEQGVNVITTGNHVYDKKDIYSYIAQHKDHLLRPANFSSEAPGVGVTTFAVKGKIIAVINLQGRVFMKEHIDCPFKTATSILTYLRDKTNIIVVDFHAETTAEKQGIAHYLDGKISALVGTHTHVQTADERILPGGTAFITDLGMAGALNSMIGMKKEPIIQHFLNQMPVKFSVETTGPFFMTGAVVEIDASTGKALKIQRIRIDDDQLTVGGDDSI